jgi:hypothetical protein
MLNRLHFVLLLLLSFSFAIDLESPRMKGVENGDVIDLGTIGPGQTLDIRVDREVKTGGLHGEGGFYDKAEAIDLPRGWTSKESELYQDPLQVTITADPDAPEGNYTMRVRVIDENNGEKLGNVTFTVKVRITWDVMDFDVSPSYINVGPGQPARFTITINNKGSTSDVFRVSALGAKRWEFIRPVFVPAQSSKTVYYEIAGTEEETYKAAIKVESLASQNIAGEKNVTLSIRPTLMGDYRATNNGVVVFPIFQGPIYALAGLISNLFG